MGNIVKLSSVKEMCFILGMVLGYSVNSGSVEINPGPNGAEDGCLFSPVELKSKRGGPSCGNPGPITVLFDGFGIARTDRVEVPKSESRSHFGISLFGGSLSANEEIRFLELSEIKPERGSLDYPDDSKLIYFLTISPGSADAFRGRQENTFLISLYWQEVSPEGDLVLKKSDQSLVVKDNGHYQLDIHWKQRYLPGSMYGSIELRLTDDETGSTVSLNRYGIPFSLNMTPLASSFFVGTLHRLQSEEMSSGYMWLVDRRDK